MIYHCLIKTHSHQDVNSCNRCVSSVRKNGFETAEYFQIRNFLIVHHALSGVSFVHLAKYTLVSNSRLSQIFYEIMRRLGNRVGKGSLPIAEPSQLDVWERHGLKYYRKHSTFFLTILRNYYSEYGIKTSYLELKNHPKLGEIL